MSSDVTFTAANYRNMTNDELARYVGLDPQATERERELALRLENTQAYIDEVTVFLAKNDLLETQRVLIQ